MSTVTVHIADRIATITFNRPKSLNTVTAEDYDAFAGALREIDGNPDVLVTVWQGAYRGGRDWSRTKEWRVSRWMLTISMV